MKKILAILLLVAFTAQCFNNTLIVISFYANQKSIASRFCENRYKPMLHCNGKCQLAKKLRQEENKDQQNPERKLEIKNEVISARSFFATPILPLEQKECNFIPVTIGKLRNYSVDIFHPPSA